MKTLIIGCGSIGAFKPAPYDDPNNDNEILSHAHAEIVKGKAINSTIFFSGDELILFDVDKSKANDAYRKWMDLASKKGIRLFYGYDNLKEGAVCTPYTTIDADKIIIATPAETHLGVVDELLKIGIKKDCKILIEKPCGSNYAECLEIRNRLCGFMKDGVNVDVRVGYQRQTLPAYNLQSQLEEGEFFQQARLIYDRGFLHDASHALALFYQWFGKCKRAVRLDNGINDRNETDRTISAFLQYKKCPAVFITPVDGREFDMFELDIFTNKKRIRFTNHGLWKEYYYRKPEPIYGNYDCIENNSSCFTTGLETALLNPFESFPTLDTALEVHRVVEMLVQYGESEDDYYV